MRKSVPIIRGGKVSGQAFTLIELLVVIGIMILMMTIAGLSWTGMRRGAEIRGASGAVRTGLMLARQQAILKRQAMTVTIREDGTNSYMDISTVTGAVRAVHSTVSLTPGIKFVATPPQVGLPTLTFTPSGGSGGGGKTLITVQERGGVGSVTQSVTLTNWNLTGITE